MVDGTHCYVSLPEGNKARSTDIFNKMKIAGDWMNYGGMRGLCT